MMQKHLPIAMLHHVSNRKDWGSLSPFVIRHETFTRFLDAIEVSGKRTITFRQLHEGLKRSRRDVIITFDDCGKHLLDFVVPELIRRNMTAVFYIPTADMGGCNSWNVADGKSRLDLMDAADLKALENEGMEVGSHSHDHIHLGEVADEEVEQQLRTSQSILTQVLGHPAVSAAYPYGGIPESTHLLKSCDFHAACSIFSPQPDQWTQRRFIVHDGDSYLALRIKLNRVYDLYRNWSDRRIEQRAS